MWGIIATLASYGHDSTQAGRYAAASLQALDNSSLNYHGTLGKKCSRMDINLQGFIFDDMQSSKILAHPCAKVSVDKAMFAEFFGAP